VYEIQSDENPRHDASHYLHFIVSDIYTYLLSSISIKRKDIIFFMDMLTSGEILRYQNLQNVQKDF